MKKILLLSALILGLAACSQNLPHGNGAPTSGTSQPTTGTSTPADSTPSTGTSSTGTSTPVSGEPYAAQHAACHANLYNQAWYGQPNRTLIGFGDHCPGGQYLLVGFFANIHDQYPAFVSDQTRSDQYLTVDGWGGYIVRTKLKLPDGTFTDWHGEYDGVLQNK